MDQELFPIYYFMLNGYDRKKLIIDWRLWIKLHETQSINKDYRTNSMETLFFMNFSLNLDFEKFKAEHNILCLTQNKQGMFKIQEVSKLHEGYLFEGWHFVQTYFKPLKSF